MQHLRNKWDLASNKVEGENWLPKVFLWPPYAHCGTYMPSKHVHSVSVGPSICLSVCLSFTYTVMKNNENPNSSNRWCTVQISEDDPLPWEVPSTKEVVRPVLHPCSPPRSQQYTSISSVSLIKHRFVCFLFTLVKSQWSEFPWEDCTKQSGCGWCCKYHKARVGDMPQLVEPLPRMHEALGSIPCTV